jgi:Actin like proteins N terminal domain
MTVATTKPPKAKKDASVAVAATSQTRTLALDAGNYDLKFWDGIGQPKAVRSVRFQLPQGRDPVRFNDTSPFLELPDGTRYHFGMQAYKYRRQQQTVIENKIDLAKLHLYACLEPRDHEEGLCEFTVNVHVSTPDPERQGEALKKHLIGIHEFTRNGVAMRVTVEQVAVEREGLGAYRCAQRMGLIADGGYTIVIDIGGGTWLSRLIDAEGDVIDENVMDRGGAYELATAISFDKRLTSALGTTADPGIIMDGFKAGHIYADTGHSWSEWLEEYLDPWYKGIFRTVKSQYTPFMPRVTRFLITGGTSYLIADKFAGFPLFAVIPDPQLANVRGLFPVEELQLCMTTN